MHLYESNDTLVAEIEGDFDAAAVKKHRGNIDELSQTKGQAVVLDLSRVSFMDSSGIGAVVYLFKRLRGSQRELALVGVNGEPAKLMKMLRIDKTIPTYASLLEFWASKNRQRGQILEAVNQS